MTNPTFWIKRENDESIVLYVGTREVAALDPAREPGEIGILYVLDAFHQIAHAVGAKVKEQ